MTIPRGVVALSLASIQYHFNQTVPRTSQPMKTITLSVYVSVVLVITSILSSAIAEEAPVTNSIYLLWHPTKAVTSQSVSPTNSVTSASTNSIMATMPIAHTAQLGTFVTLPPLPPQTMLEKMCGHFDYYTAERTKGIGWYQEDILDIGKGLSIVGSEARPDKLSMRILPQARWAYPEFGAGPTIENKYFIGIVIAGKF